MWPKPMRMDWKDSRLLFLVEVCTAAEVEDEDVGALQVEELLQVVVVVVGATHADVVVVVAGGVHAEVLGATH